MTDTICSLLRAIKDAILTSLIKPCESWDAYEITTIDTSEHKLATGKCRIVSLMADPNNTNQIYISGKDNPSSPFELRAGIAMDIRTNEMSTVRYKGAAIGLKLGVKWEA